jgi:hypothetical protein
MPITIKQAQNGWLMIHSEEGEPDQLVVFGEDVEDWRDLLITLDDLYGPQESKQRICISIKDKAVNNTL